MSWPCHEVSEFQDFLTHAQTVCTRPFFFLPRAKRARLRKRGTGDEANIHTYIHTYIHTCRMMVFADICTTTSSFDPAQLTLVTRDHTLNISWVVSDNVGVGLFYVGLIPAEDYSEAVEMDYQVLTGGLPHHSVTDPSILQDGNLFYLSVRAEDLALHSTTVTVGPVLVHLTPPLTNGSLQVQQQQGHLTVTWSEGSISEEEGAWPVTIHYAIGMFPYPYPY